MAATLIALPPGRRGSGMRVLVVEDDVVQVYVSSLRRKIDAGGAPSLIDTVWGIGYRMREDP